MVNLATKPDLLGLPDPVGLIRTTGLSDPIGLIRKKSTKTYRVWKTQQVALLLVCMLLASCQQNYTPKPHAYYRIDFPNREYRLYDSICPFTFEYPVYGTLVHDHRPTSGPCWFDINFPKYKGTIYLTYLEIDSNFDQFIEDNWKMVYTKIAQKADAVDENLYINPDMKIFGTLYDIRGNAASAVLFYVTDSTKNLLRGSLYFATKPNQDSLAPAVAFFREDIIHLMKTIRWKDVISKK